MSSPPRDDHGPIAISTVTINAVKHLRQLQSAILIVNEHKKEAQWRYSGSLTAEATFEPALNISSSDQLKIRLHRSFHSGSIKWLEKDDEILIHARQFFSANSQGSEEGRGSEWRQSFEGTEVIIRLVPGATSQSRPSTTVNQDRSAPNSKQHEDSLPIRDGKLTPTTDDIIRICPRFRILVIGNSGVGKSSLINRAFGTELAKESELLPGDANINVEIPSKANPRFVLHDSLGFEAGDISNLQIVQDFITSRSKLPNLMDQLHAIWLCLETPTENSRIFETGIERLLEAKQKGHLGKVPLIIVFTKYDELVDREEMEFDVSQRQGLSKEEVSERVRGKASMAFTEECIAPLKSRLESQIPPYKEVSIRESFEATLADLIQLTFDSVHEHVAKEASVVTAIAQKINPDVKVDGSIAVGRSKYWSSLASSINFPGKTILECLEVIHTDIIVVWDFNDPDKNLESEEFKALMSNMVNDITVTNPNAMLVQSARVVGSVIGAVVGLAAPLAPIVIPIAAGVVLAKWVYDVYQNSRKTLERLMAYIVDLTLVMEHIFCLMQGKSPTTSRRVIKLAYKTYYESELKSTAHAMIASHVKGLNLLRPGAQDTTINKIVEIIGISRIPSSELPGLKASLESFDLSGPDEPWDVPKSNP